MRLQNVAVVFLSFQCVYLWDPDAGVVPSLTKQPSVTITATSSATSVQNVLDDNDSTHWMSSGCLPTFYFNRPDVNILLGACESGMCRASSVPRNDISGATDGGAYKSGHFSAVIDANGHTKAFFTVNVSAPLGIKLLTLDGVYNSRTDVIVRADNGTSDIVATLDKSNSYKAIQIWNINRTFHRIELRSDNDFVIREIAAIGPNGCTENVTVDLGHGRQVGKIRTRHWAGTHAAKAIDLKTSNDGKHWIMVQKLDPEALHAVTTTLFPATVRYIQLVYYTELIDYKKVYCWEIDAWDENGRWGPKIVSKPQKHTLVSIFGVNGIWGWGHSMYSTGLNPGEGPWLYNAVASHARNYHNLGWDVTDPDNDPQYQKMAAGHGTQSKSWLNWDTEYGAWKNASLITDASIQFTNKSFPQTVWNNPEQAAYHYGYEFARHFGPSTGKNLIAAMEVGNEPWDYTANFYATILKGMSAGARSGDPSIKVLPGAFQADDKHSTGNYIGTRVLPEVASNIDAINFHTYSYFNNEQGVRTGTFPEHRDSSFNSVRNIIRWKNTNMPNTPIWVTEWGWDASGGGEDCTVPECVDETAQALYGIRGLLILARHNVEKATWFFYANSGCTTLYCRSGLTTSQRHDFAKKQVFLGFQTLLSIIGDKYFLGIFQEDDSAFVYMFGDSFRTQNSSATVDSVWLKTSHLVAWRPDSSDSTNITIVNIPLPHGKTVKTAYTFRAVQHRIVPVKPGGLFQVRSNLLTLHLTPRPLIIEISDTDTSAIIG